jgi:trk system potassium uptake protein TrkH
VSFARRLDPLSYAVRPRVIGKYLGQLTLVVALLTLIPTGVAFLTGDGAMAMRGLAVIAVLSLTGLPLSRIGLAEDIQMNEALVVVALTFVLAALAVSAPLAVPGVALVDVFFEAVSAVTTTGLTTVGSVEERSAGFLFARAWAQWFGGLGIVVFSAVLLLLEPGIASKRLAITEAEGEGLRASTRAQSRIILLVYVSLTLGGIAVLWLLGLSGFEALVHALTAISTGGFSTHDDSLAGLGPWSVQLAVMAIAFLGAVSLPLYYHGLRRRPESLLPAALELRALVLAVVLSSALLGLVMGMGGSLGWREILVHAPLLGTSAQTGTGFTTVSVAELDPAAKLVLMSSMAIGGSVGSTTGGIKVLRLLIILRMVQLLLLRTRLPRHAVAEPRLGDERLGANEIERTLLLVVLMLATIVISWFAFLLAGHDPLNALFDVVSATATVGLSSGVSAPTLEPGLKLVLCLDMILGRVEFLAVLVVLFPPTWIGRRTP